MTDSPTLGRILVLNGVPRSGKSSLARAIQDQATEPWLHLGVDHMIAATPEQWHPGMGLRPGRERPDLEPLVRASFLTLYAALAEASRQGLNVVGDVGHHAQYVHLDGLLEECAKRVAKLPAYLVGVRCPAEVITARRLASGRTTDPHWVRVWDEAVHTPGHYDREVNTAIASPEALASQLLDWLATNPPPLAFRTLSASR